MKHAPDESGHGWRQSAAARGHQSRLNIANLQIMKFMNDEAGRQAEAHHSGLETKLEA